MAKALSFALSWMPELEYYCGTKLFSGARCAIIFYMVASVICMGKPILLISYHHESEMTLLPYFQWFFVYAAAALGFFTFYLGFPLARRIKTKNIPENTVSLLFILFCLMLGAADVMWALLSFARAFSDPGIFNTDNATNFGSGFSSSSRREQRRRRERERQWRIDHPNETIVTIKTTTRDAIGTTIYALVQLYAFYPLMCLRSYLSEDDDEE